MRRGTSRVIFVHVPKTAGTSLVAMMEAIRGPRHTVRLYAGEYGIPLEALLGWSRHEQRRITLVTGHIKYGLGELLPGRSVYVTMLRDPVDRIVSHHSYMLTEPSLVELHDARGSNRSLEAQTTRSPLRHLVNNGQTRQLGGNVLDRGHQPATAADLERAMQRIDDDFAVVGLYEQFETSVQLVRALLGRHDVAVPRLNVTASRPTVADIEAGVRAAIEEHNQLDLALYAHARQRFIELVDAVPT